MATGALLTALSEVLQSAPTSKLQSLPPPPQALNASTKGTPQKHLFNFISAQSFGSS
jgi:hypothetical protein